MPRVSPAIRIVHSKFIFIIEDTLSNSFIQEICFFCFKVFVSLYGALSELVFNTFFYIYAFPLAICDMAWISLWFPWLYGCLCIFLGCMLLLTEGSTVDIVKGNAKVLAISQAISFHVKTARKITLSFRKDVLLSRDECYFVIALSFFDKKE